MFDAIKTAFQQGEASTYSRSNYIAGFCVAGGSTKGEFPTAMQKMIHRMLYVRVYG
jgi:hypothetical protein